MKRNSWAGLALGIGLWSAASLAGAANVTANAELGLTNFNRTATQTCAGCVATASGNLGVDPLGFSTSGSASASADYGVLRASGNFQAFGPHTGVIVDGIKAKATFEDNFIIDKLGLTGTAGVVDIPLYFAWNVTGSSTFGGTSFLASNQFNTRFFRSNNNSLIIANFFREDFDTGGSTGKSASVQDASGTFTSMPFSFMPTISVSFTYGEVIKVIQTLDIIMSATDYNTTTPAQLFGINDAGHSAYWGGFAAVRDAAENLVQDYTVQSGSGTNWAVSMIPVANVPEPGSLAMMLAGLGLVLPLVRRRRIKALAASANRIAA